MNKLKTYSNLLKMSKQEEEHEQERKNKSKKKNEIKEAKN